MAGILSTSGIEFIARVIAFATAIPFHEAAHAFVSDKLGDHTARDLGRLTLNPIKHIDPWGLIAMVTIGIGWAKPVPVNPSGYKNPRYGMALTAIAGPISNLILAYLNMVLYKLVVNGFNLYSINNPQLTAVPVWLQILVNILYYLAFINVNLAVFNMLPVPPFDGSRVFGLLLPESLYFKVMKYERYMMFAMLALLWLGVFTTLLVSVNGFMMNLLNTGTGYIDWIFKSMMGQ